MYKHICEYGNGTIKPIDIMMPELEQFIGILFYMSIVRMSRADMVSRCTTRRLLT